MRVATSAVALLGVALALASLTGLDRAWLGREFMLVTSGSMSPAISPGDIVIVRSGWTQRSLAAASPGGVPLAWAVADRFVVQAATVASPTWQQSGTPVSRWIYAGSAFG